jgi:hypothetical protein
VEKIIRNAWTQARLVADWENYTYYEHLLGDTYITLCHNTHCFRV